MQSLVIDSRRSILAGFPQNAVGVEIGVWRGDFSRQIVDICRPRLLHLIDPWKVSHTPVHSQAWYGSKVNQEIMDGHYKYVLERFSHEIAGQQVHVDRRPSETALADLEAGSVDFVYVDGDHNGPSVLADLRASYRILREGGVLAGDDYALNGWWGDGVVRALHTFLAESNVFIEMVIDRQFMLRKLG